MEIDGWSSHLPILQKIVEKYKIERVLETGIGKYSTPFFLKDFPDLKELISIEDDEEWIKKTPTNPKQKIILAEKDKVFEKVKELDLSNFDLIFIDDSHSMNARVKTIRLVSEKKPNCIVVVHDFHVQRYQDAANFKYIQKIDNYEIPNSKVSTGIMSNKIDIRSLKDEISIFKKEK